MRKGGGGKAFWSSEFFRWTTQNVSPPYILNINHISPVLNLDQSEKLLYKIYSILIIYLYWFIYLSCLIVKRSMTPLNNFLPPQGRSFFGGEASWVAWFCPKFASIPLLFSRREWENSVWFFTQKSKKNHKAEKYSTNPSPGICIIFPCLYSFFEFWTKIKNPKISQVIWCHFNYWKIHHSSLLFLVFFFWQKYGKYDEVFSTENSM